MLGLMSYLKFHPSNTCEAKRLMSARCSISWHIQVDGENIKAWINLHPPICIAGTPRSEIRMWHSNVEEASNLHFHLCICLTSTICVQHIACIMHVESYNKCKYEWCNIICIYTCTRTLCNYTQLHWNCRLQMTVGMSVPAQLCQCHKGVQRNRFHSYTESEKCCHCQQGQSKEVLDFEIDMLNHQLHRIHCNLTMKSLCLFEVELTFFRFFHMPARWIKAQKRRFLGVKDFMGNAWGFMMFHAMLIPILDRILRGDLGTVCDSRISFHKKKRLQGLQHKHQMALPPTQQTRTAFAQLAVGRALLGPGPSTQATQSNRVSWNNWRHWKHQLTKHDIHPGSLTARPWK